MGLLESKYLEVKDYLNYATNTSFVARKCGVSTPTVNRIKKSKNYEDYKEISRSESNNRKKERNESNEDNKAQEKADLITQHYINTLADRLKNMNEILISMHGYIREGTKLLNELNEKWK